MNFHSFLPSLIHSLIVVTGWEMKRGIPMKMVAVSSVSRKKTSRKREKPFFFLSFSLVDVVSFRFCYHIPHNWNFLRMCCSLLPPLAVLSLFSFFPVYTQKYFSSSFSFSQFRLELLPSLVLPHPARLNRERTRTQGQLFKRLLWADEIWKKESVNICTNYFPP